MSYDTDVTAVRRALIRRLRAGQDVGEFLVAAVAAAQQQLNDLGDYESLTQNRAGSWEAALLDAIIQAGPAS